MQSSMMMTMTVRERLQQLKKHWKRQQKQILPEERFHKKSSDQFQIFIKGRQHKCKIIGAYGNAQEQLQKLVKQPRGQQKQIAAEEQFRQN